MLRRWLQAGEEEAVKKSKLVRRSELRKMRHRLAVAEKHDSGWCQLERNLLSERIAVLERWIDTLQRAAVANPEAMRELAHAALVAKQEPWW